MSLRRVRPETIGANLMLGAALVVAGALIYLAVTGMHAKISEFFAGNPAAVAIVFLLFGIVFVIGVGFAFKWVGRQTGWRTIG